MRVVSAPAVAVCVSPRRACTDGDTEVGYEFKTGYGLAYITRMNQELQKMAVRGLTVFAGAGDAGWTNVGEMGNDLSNPDRTCGIMRAFYPSESPYVVSMSASFVDGNVETPVSVRGAWPRPLRYQCDTPPHMAARTALLDIA